MYVKGAKRKKGSIPWGRRRGGWVLQATSLSLRSRIEGLGARSCERAALRARRNEEWGERRCRQRRPRLRDSGAGGENRRDALWT